MIEGRERRGRSLERPLSENNLDIFTPQQLRRSKSHTGIIFDSSREIKKEFSLYSTKERILAESRKFDLERKEKLMREEQERRKKMAFRDLNRPMRSRLDPETGEIVAMQISEEEIDAAKIARRQLSSVELEYIKRRLKKDERVWRMERAKLWMSNNYLNFARVELGKRKRDEDTLESEKVLRLMKKRFPEEASYLKEQGREMLKEEFYREVILCSERDRVVRERFISSEHGLLVRDGADSEKARAGAEKFYTKRTELMGEEMEWLLANSPEMDLREARDQAVNKAGTRINIIKGERDALVRSGMSISEAMEKVGWIDTKRTQLIGEEMEWLLEDSPEMDLREARGQAVNKAGTRINIIIGERDALVRSGMSISEAMEKVEQKYS